MENIDNKIKELEEKIKTSPSSQEELIKLLEENFKLLEKLNKELNG